MQRVLAFSFQMDLLTLVEIKGLCKFCRYPDDQIAPYLADRDLVFLRSDLVQQKDPLGLFGIEIVLSAIASPAVYLDPLEPKSIWLCNFAARCAFHAIYCHFLTPGPAVKPTCVITHTSSSREWLKDCTTTALRVLSLMSTHLSIVPPDLLDLEQSYPSSRISLTSFISNRNLNISTIADRVGTN